MTTAVEDDGALDPTLTPDRTSPSGSEAKPGAYELRRVLGRGGMGEVMLAEDRAIGREVAVKRMHAGADSAAARERFLREAKIQARLDHPAIVPVHEIGADAAGVPYFTMKRLTGVTLQALLDGGVATPQKLLRAFIDVCNAIDFAHARGVIHRDLKPANIMLGDYGEVYVLDWGLARVVDDTEEIGGGPSEVTGLTQAGAILGTPGYMSPEQVLGERLTVATDVYALGSILFEILVGGPAHPRGQAALKATLHGVVDSPRVREPGIAPELDRICMQALATRASDRPTLPTLRDTVQRYLDGDRDKALRRELATEQLAQARAAEDPAVVMAAAGRALALDPTSRDAAALVTRLMLEPAPTPPPGLVERIRRADIDDIAHQGRVTPLAMLAYLACAPFAIATGVRQWWMLLAAGALAVFVAVGLVWTIKRRAFNIAWAIAGHGAMVVLISRMTGTLLLAPGVAGAIAVSLMAFPTLAERPLRVIAPMLAAFLVPFALEVVGVLERTWSIGSGGLVITPTVLRYESNWAIAFVIASNIALVVATSLYMQSVAMSARRTRNELERQAYQLEHLIPGDRDSRARSR